MENQDRVSDWLALCEAKARYCRTLDTKDWAGYAALLTEDYVLDVSDGTNVPVIHGRDAAIKQIQSSILTAKTAAKCIHRSSRSTAMKLMSSGRCRIE